MEETPSSDTTCLSRVEGPSLDPQKKWYVLSKELISSPSCRLVDIYKSISKLFPDEIQNVASRQIHPAKPRPIEAFNSYTRRPSNVYVVSTFGRCVGLLRQRDILSYDLLRSPVFQSIVQLLNSIDLDQREESVTFGRETFP